MIYLDVAIFCLGWIVGQLVFHNYEAHVPYTKRVVKFLVLATFFGLIYQFLERSYFYGILGLMAIAMAWLHGYWFHYKHGIHWRKAEPRDKYLQLIGKQN